MGNFDDFSRQRGEFFNYLSDDYKKENDLMSVMINEVYNKYGVCMDYHIISYDTNYDAIFGEDNDRRCVRQFKFSGMFNLPKEDKIWSKFGIEGMDEIVCFVSKRHFDGASYDNETKQIYPRPQMGDIVKTGYSSFYYEITEVAEDVGQFLQSNQHVWEIHMRPMKDEFIEDTTTAGRFAKDLGFGDLFDISGFIDNKKDAVLYKPDVVEQSVNDPFAGW